jgi:hypothetical protein
MMFDGNAPARRLRKSLDHCEFWEPIQTPAKFFRWLVIVMVARIALSPNSIGMRELLSLMIPVDSFKEFDGSGKKIEKAQRLI